LSERVRSRNRKRDGQPGHLRKAAGVPHVLITRTPDGRLTFLQAIGSRRKDAIAAGLLGLGSAANLWCRLHRVQDDALACSKLAWPHRSADRCLVPSSARLRLSGFSSAPACLSWCFDAALTPR
jgi:hypothetical protein